MGFVDRVLSDHLSVLFIYVIILFGANPVALVIHPNAVKWA